MENQKATGQYTISNGFGSNPKILQNAKAVKENSMLDSLSKTSGIENKNVDYESVIQQFNDLISELSDSRYMNKKDSSSTSYLYNNEENIKNFSKNLKNKVVEPHEKNCTGSAYFEKTLKPTQSCTASYKTLQSKSNHTDSNDMYVPELRQYKLNKTVLHNNLLPKGQESISWVNSHLWQLENEKHCFQAQKPNSEIESTFTDILNVNSKRDIKFTEYATRTALHSNIFNPSLCSKHLPINNMNYPYYKNDSSFMCSEALAKGRYKPAFEPHRIHISGAASHSFSKSKFSASKYNSDNCFLVKLYIETKDLHLGPFSFEIYSKMSLRLLKLKVEQEHGITASSQRWILGKYFAIDNDKSLADYNVIPGSSIILYVDSKKQVSGNKIKNELVNHKDTIQVNKVLTSNVAIKEKEKSDSFDSLMNASSFRGSKELTRKDSLDSKLTQLSLENNVLRCRKLSNQSSDNSSIDVSVTEQTTSAMKKDVKFDEVKSPVFKKKVLKKNIDPKKKTKIVIHQKQSTHNYMEKSFQNNSQFHSFEGYACNGISSNENMKFGLENNLLMKSLNKTKHKPSESMLPNYVGNDFDVNTQYKEQANSNFVSPNISENFQAFRNVESSIDYKDENAAHESSEYIFKRKYHVEEMKEKQNQSILTSQEETDKSLAFNGGKMQEIPSYENKDSLVNEIPNSVNVIKYCNEVLFLKDEFENFDELNKNAGKNKKEDSSRANAFDETEKVDLCNTDRPELIRKPENLMQSSMHILDDNEEMGNMEENLKGSKSKRSVTSLIRKLTLTRKAKSSVDDTSSLQMADTDFTVDPKHLTTNLNLPLHSDVHIEISSENSSVPAENENAENTNYNIQGDSSVHDVEAIKNFELLMEIENMDLVENTTNFICPVCFEEFESGQGVILHDCLHTFCRDCLSNSVRYSDGALVKCPFRDDLYSCQSYLQQREIKALVSEDIYEKYLQRSIITAEGLAERSFHCKTPDCPGWCVYDNAINVFHCPVCFHYNCLNCQAIHEGLNCRQYQDQLRLKQKVDKESEKTLELLNKMIESGKALRCPKCDLILMKKWGCDWLKCSVCKTEICWITKGPRWGPGGQGDTSGGCKCGVNGVKCHPSCTYCH